MNWFREESFEELQRLFDFDNGNLTAAGRQKKTRIDCEKLHLGAVNELFKMFSARSMDSKPRLSSLEKLCERVRDLLGTSNVLKVPGFKKGAEFVFHLTELVAIACKEVILDLSMSNDQKEQYGHLFSQLKTDLEAALDSFEEKKEHPKKLLLQEFVKVLQNLSENCQLNATSWTVTPPSIINNLKTVHTRVNKQLNSPEGPSFGWSKSCTALKDILVEVNKILDKYLNFDLSLTLLEDPGFSSNSFLSDTGPKTVEFEPHYIFVDDQPNGSHFPCYKYQVPWMTPELVESCSQFFSPVDLWFLQDDENSDHVKISGYISQDNNVSTTVILPSSNLEEEPAFKKPKLGC